MEGRGQAVHRTIIAVDVEGFGDRRRTNRNQVVRDGLYRAMRGAFRLAGIPWADCYHEDRGDGMFILAGGEVPKSLFVESLPSVLTDALRGHNDAHSDAELIRLRMALHAGEVHYDEHGVVSASINHTFRLLEAGPVKQALADSSGVLAVITSSWFFEEVVRHSAADVAAYRPVSVTVKETSTTGWICLPDQQDRPGRTTLKSSSAQATAVTRPAVAEHDGKARAVGAREGHPDQVIRHAFISYARGDANHVNRLQRWLESADVPVWRDTADLWPGEDWRAKIRQAIQDDALVFIACFSQQSVARIRSYQNEELLLAIDELRRRHPEFPWLIPVRFDECDIPDLDIGGGRTLTWLHRVDIFGDRAEEGAARLAASVLRIIGRNADISATMSPGAGAFGPALSQTGNQATGATASEVSAKHAADMRGDKSSHEDTLAKSRRRQPENSTAEVLDSWNEQDSRRAANQFQVTGLTRPTSEESESVFISYSPEDVKFLRMLLRHLRVLEHQGLRIFTREALIPGTRWQEEMNFAISNVAVIILLVTPDYLASEAAPMVHLPQILASAEERGTTILPLLVKPSLFSSYPYLSRFRALNPAPKTLIEMNRPGERERFLMSVAEEVQKLTIFNRQGDSL